MIFTLRFLVFLAPFLAACSLVVDRNPDQCVSDKECERFSGHPVCVNRVCVASGLGPVGCFFGTPQKDAEFLNQCTTATALPFDNCKVLGLCSGALPPLKDPP